MDAALIEFIIRVFGRIGFILLLWGGYRLWRLPVLRKHSRQIFWLLMITSAISLTYSTITYFILELSNPVYNLIFLLFNTISTWLLAIIMHYRAYTINKRVGRQKLDEYTKEVDRIITELKESTVQK